MTALPPLHPEMADELDSLIQRITGQTPDPHELDSLIQSAVELFDLRHGYRPNLDVQREDWQWVYWQTLSYYDIDAGDLAA